MTCRPLVSCETVSAEEVMAEEEEEGGATERPVLVTTVKELGLIRPCSDGGEAG